MMAGAQLQNCTLQDAERRIREQIDLYRADDKRKILRTVIVIKILGGKPL
mgnify:CR=1 FL=1